MGLAGLDRPASHTLDDGCSPPQPPRTATTTTTTSTVPPAALLGFPSPASVRAPLFSPTLGNTLRNDPCIASPHYSPLETRPVATQPGDVRIPTGPMTPLPDDVFLDSAMDLAVGGVLAPVQITPALPSSLPTKRDVGLRLPSFEKLGIAMPHPDRRSVNHPLQHAVDGASGSGGIEGAATADSLSSTDDRSRVPSSTRARANHPNIKSDRPPAVDSPLKLFVNSLTPPAEIGAFAWDVASMTAALPAPVTFAGLSNVEVEASAVEEGGSSVLASQEVVPRPWMDTIISVLLASIPQTHSSLSVLSHALPVPSATGHIFSAVIAALHQSTPGTDTVWVNVFHAIPGRFNIADIPTSPPATPAPLGTGEDYFTSKTFSSLVPILDYQASRLPRSPCPVVRPSSMDLAIVERYIPPTNVNEFATMFSPSGPSLLVDRLVELSPEKGTLLFIYPTRAGAETFMTRYLSPILDRALRSMAVVHNLPSDFAQQIGGMAAVASLPSFAALQKGVQSLCAKLSNPQSSTQRFLSGYQPSSASLRDIDPSRTRTRCTFSLVHSSTASVPLDRHSWAREWWTKQEKPRIREIVERFSRDPTRRVDDYASTPVVLLQNLLEDVVRRGYPDGWWDGGQDPGVEVGVFVLSRRIVVEPIPANVAETE